MDAKTLKSLAEQFDTLAETISAISGTFRAASGDSESDSGDAPAGKPVRGSKSRTATKPTKAKAPEKEDNGLTEDDLREKLTQLAAEKGKSKVAEALAEVGAGRLTDVSEDDYQTLADTIDKMMEEEDEPPAKPAKGKKTKAKAAAPTYDEVKEKFEELVAVDKKKAKAVLTEAGLARLSEADPDDEGTMTDLMTAIMEALESEDDGLM